MPVKGIGRQLNFKKEQGIVSAGNMTNRLKPALHTRIITFIGPALTLASLLSLPLQASETEDCTAQFENTRYQAAKNVCQQAAELGDAKAAFLLATIYYQGLTGSADDQRGLFWDKVAAEKGYPEAAYRLALAYQIGQGTALDESQAFRWYMQAARAHHAKAQRNLGAMYESGAGVEKNIEKAYFWYLQSAKQGVSDAQLRVGTMLLEGRGVAEDRATAQHWIRKSAQAGNHNAQLALGVMLAEIDPADSVVWYQKSADQGNLFAKHNLALVYFTGQGVAVDYQRALQFAHEAVDSGNVQAQPLLKQIRLKLQQQIVSDLQAEKARVSNLINASEGKNVVLTQTAAKILPAAVVSSAFQPSPEVAGAVRAAPAQPAVGVVAPGPASAPAEAEYQALPDGWILTQPAQRFVIQLTYGMDEKGIHKYIRQSGLTDNVRYYRTQRDAGLFYMLVFGEYESVAEAQQAVAQLPAAARKSHWIRKIATLQEHYRTPLL